MAAGDKANLAKGAPKGRPPERRTKPKGKSREGQSRAGRTNLNRPVPSGREPQRGGSLNRPMPGYREGTYSVVDAGRGVSPPGEQRKPGKATKNPHGIMGGY